MADKTQDSFQIPEHVVSQVKDKISSIGPIIDERDLENQLKLYEHFANVSDERAALDLLEQSAGFIDSSVSDVLLKFENEHVEGSLVGQNIRGSSKSDDRYFDIPLAFENGRLSAQYSEAFVGLPFQAESTRPLQPQEIALVEPVVDHILVGSTLLLHENVKRQIAEFEKVRSLLEPVSIAEEARADAQLRLLANPQTSHLTASDGSKFKLVDWTVPGYDHMAEGRIKPPDGQSILVDAARSYNSLNDPGIRLYSSAPKNYTQPVQEFFQARVAEYDYANAVKTRAELGEVISSGSHPMFELEARTRAIEESLSEGAIQAQEAGIDFDGPSIKNSSRGR